MSPLNNPQPSPLSNSKLPMQTPNFLKDIEGYIRTVIINPVVAPTYIPKNFRQQFEIRMDKKVAPTTMILFIYSFETKIWTYITLH